MSYFIARPAAAGNGDQVKIASGSSTESTSQSIQGGFVQAYFYSPNDYVINGTTVPGGVPLNFEFGGKQHDDDLTINASGGTLIAFVVYG